MGRVSSSSTCLTAWMACRTEGLVTQISHTQLGMPSSTHTTCGGGVQGGAVGTAVQIQTCAHIHMHVVFKQVDLLLA
jgi:hypothetical protein